MCCRRSDPMSRLWRARTMQSTRRQSGAALIVALLVFAIASALIVGLQRDFSLQLQRGSNALLAEQGWAYLRGAEALAAAALRMDAEQDAERESPRDDLTELWARPATPYPLEEGGWLQGELEDLQGRFNLNLLIDSGAGSNDEGQNDADSTDGGAGDASPGSSALGEQRLTGPQRQLIRLLQALDGVQVDRTQAVALTEAIADFMDADDQRRLEGAENEAYRNLQPPYLPANRPMASVSELRAVTGMTAEIYRALAPLVTVWPVSGGKLNILTAPVPVLRSLNIDERLEPLDVGTAEEWALRRADGDLDGVETLLADAVFTQGSTEKLSAYLAESSDWFLLRANVEIAERELRLYSVLQREAGSVVSRFRSQGEL